MRVTVVGGGIAGLTCALSLHAAGFEPLVCEAARTVEAVGVGINLLPHAVRELCELGLDCEPASVALLPRLLSYRPSGTSCSCTAASWTDRAGRGSTTT